MWGGASTGHQLDPLDSWLSDKMRERVAAVITENCGRTISEPFTLKSEAELRGLVVRVLLERKQISTLSFTY